MRLKVILELTSPFIVTPYLPVDGILSFALAVKTGFKLKDKAGSFRLGGLELPVSKYGYILELPIEKITYGNGNWFYAVSVLFGSARRTERRIFRKFPNIGREIFKEYSLYRSNYSSVVGSGKMRAMVRPITAYECGEVYFYASVPDDRVEEFAEIVETLKHTGIGKKTTHGYGSVKDVFIEEVEEEEFDGLFVKAEAGMLPARPIPVEMKPEIMLPEGYYPLELYTSVLPPYYLPTKMERCYFCYPYPLVAS